MELSEALKVVNSAHTQTLLRQGRATSKILEAIQTLEGKSEEVTDDAEESNRFAFAQISYEQCLKLNAWWTGSNLILDFDANRGGKTTRTIFDGILWMFPNDPSYRMFNLPSDHLGRPRSLLPRPPLRNIRAIRTLLNEKGFRPNPLFPHTHADNLCAYKFLQDHPSKPLQPAYPYPPVYPESASISPNYTIWHGAPDKDFYNDICHKEWLKWLPKDSIRREVEYDMEIDIVVNTPKKQIHWHIKGKSYDAKEQKWAGKAVVGIILTEGVPQDKLNEVKQRFTEHSFGSWDYTPYEDRQTRSSSAIAFKVFKGEEKLPGQSACFTGFGIKDIPNYILPQSKKEEMIRMWEGTSQGKARIHGNFYSATLLVLTHLDETIHTLQWSKADLFQKFPTGILVRSLDPGQNHPTAAVWALLAPTNEWYIYRSYCKSGTTISERCEDVISMSGNQRELLLPDDEITSQHHNLNERFVELQTNEKYYLTYIDYHTFKADETTGRPFIFNYIKEGIIPTRSTTVGPEQRAIDLNDVLRPRLHHPHPQSNLPPGAGVYFLINEPGVAALYRSLENLHWGIFQGGEQKGMPKDQIQTVGDDPFDALSYITNSPLRYEFVVPQTLNVTQHTLSSVQKLQPLNSSIMSGKSLLGPVTEEEKRATDSLINRGLISFPPPHSTSGPTPDSENQFSTRDDYRNKLRRILDVLTQ